MTHIQTNFGDLLAQLTKYRDLWVYVPGGQRVAPDAVCFLIDADNCELGDDDFTPLFAQENGLEEFLLVQDIQSIRNYLSNGGITENLQAEIFSVQYYFDNDAYPSDEDLAVFT